jgi:hypothetical protein
VGFQGVVRGVQYRGDYGRQVAPWLSVHTNGAKRARVGEVGM